MEIFQIILIALIVIFFIVIAICSIRDLYSDMYTKWHDDKRCKKNKEYR